MSPRQVTTAHRTHTPSKDLNPNTIPQPYHTTTHNKSTAQTTLWNFIQNKMQPMPPIQTNKPQLTHDTQNRTTTPPNKQRVNGRRDATPTTQAIILNLQTPPSTPVNPESLAHAATYITEPQQTTLTDDIHKQATRHNHPWGDTWAMNQPHSWF